MSATDKAIDHLNDLRNEVRHLGGMLGRTIAELEGEQVLATVELLRTLASENKDELIKVAVAGWKKTLGGKNCLTLSVSQPYQKAKDDGDVPF